MSPALPTHLRVEVTDVNGEYATAACARCGARASIGRYGDPALSQIRLVAWIVRHTHPEEPREAP